MWEDHWADLGNTVPFWFSLWAPSSHWLGFKPSAGCVAQDRWLHLSEP